jgi:hypothetical protein
MLRKVLAMLDPSDAPPPDPTTPYPGYPSSPYPGYPPPYQSVAPTQPGMYPGNYPPPQPRGFAPPVPVALPPVTTRRGPLGIILAAVSVLVLVAAFGALLFFHAHAPGTNTTVQQAQAQAILNGAAQVHLRDTQMNVTLTTSSDTAGTTSSAPLALTETGNMAITSKPFRIRLILHISLPGSLYGNTSETTEEIITSDAIYIKFPPLLNQSHKTKPWIKVSLGSALGGSSLDDSGFLDFSRLTHPQLIGEEVINGRKTWHLRATLGDVLNGNPSEDATATAIAGTGLVQNLKLVEDLWIIEANSFPAQIKLHESATTRSYGTPTSGLTVVPISIDETYVFTSWNTGLTIALPPANQVTTETAGSAFARSIGSLAAPVLLPADLWRR